MRLRRDGVPYDAWIANGYLRTCPTPIIDKRVVLEWVAEVQLGRNVGSFFALSTFLRNAGIDLMVPKPGLALIQAASFVHSSRSSSSKMNAMKRSARTRPT